MLCDVCHIETAMQLEQLAPKVRLHGMRSSRWTTRDKIMQFKGLISLYTRDKRVLGVDYAVAKKKQVKEIKQLKDDIKSNRAELNNAIQGDRQRLRNALAEQRELQLGFQNLHPRTVLENLHQTNFNQRKLLDRLDYRMKQKTETLIALKLELAELEDTLTYEGIEELPDEQKSQIVTGKVQDAILKKEAAISVRATYKNILNIMKKDTIFFDAVLGTLKYDNFVQSKCLIRLTELGQLATEYVDDRKQEFEELERVVKRDMKIREQSLKSVRKEVSDMTHNMGLLIRRDSDINLGVVSVPPTSDDLILQQELEGITKILKELQEVTYVSSFEDIFTCLVEQRNQKRRLRQLLEQSLANRDKLMNKKNHAEKMLAQTQYTINSTTYQYKNEKERLLQEISNQKKKKQDLTERYLEQGNLLANVRSSLQQLSQKCAIIKSKEVKAEPKKIGLKAAVAAAAETTSIKPPPYFEEDGAKIIDILLPKLTALVNNIPAELSGEKKEQAYKYFQQLQSTTSSKIPIEEEVVEESLLTDIVIEDTSVPTYSDIKALSKQLVDICSIDPDTIPSAPARKKYKPKK